MGRLFWKFFLFFLLAHLSTVVGISVLMSLRHEATLAALTSLDAPEPPPRPVLNAPAGDPTQPPGRPRADTPPPPPPGPPRPPGRSPAVLPILAGLLASLVFSALLAAYVSRPIRTLRNALATAGRGVLDVRVAAAIGGRRDELADLGRAFDRMADRLQAVLSSQQRLLHDVSHELRSPLARQQLALDLARQQPDKTDACMARLERELVRMDTLVGELLTLSRLDTGLAATGEEDIEVSELLAGIFEDAGFEAEQRGRHLRLCGGDLDATVRGRPELLHRAIENVVRNAIQHTAPDTEVTIEVASITAPAPNRSDGTSFVPALGLSILDNGPGVADEDLPRLFEPFYRGRDSHGRDGHGLGLAIAQRVIHAHGGRISAQLRSEGGLRMDIVLPLATPTTT